MVNNLAPVHDCTLLFSAIRYWIEGCEYKYRFSETNGMYSQHTFTPIPGQGRKANKVLSSTQIHKVRYDPEVMHRFLNDIPDIPPKEVKPELPSNHQLSAVLRQESPLIYGATVPWAFISSFCTFADPALPPIERAQRIPEPRRAREIANFLLSQKDPYLPPMIAAVMGEGIEFKPFKQDGSNGILVIPLSCLFELIDGQHRTLGIRQVLQGERAAEFLGRTISMDIFVNPTMELRRRVFREVNSLGKTVSKNLTTLYADDPMSAFVKEALATVPLFSHAWVEQEKSSIAAKSEKMFLYKHLYDATVLIKPGQSRDTDFIFCQTFWQTLAEVIQQWSSVAKGHLTPTEVRANTICSHGVVIHAFGELGKFFTGGGQINLSINELRDRLNKLSAVDWSKTNPDWLNRVVDDRGGLLSKRQNVKLMLNYLKLKCGAPVKSFSVEEKQLEQEHIGNLNLFGGLR